MKVKDISIKRAHCVSPATNLVRVASIMRRYKVNTVPVCLDKKLLGILTAEDLVTGCMARSKDPLKCKAGKFMSSKSLAVSLDMELEEVARIMSREQILYIPVVEQGIIIGMVSAAQIAIMISEDDILVNDLIRRSSDKIFAVSS